MNLATGMLIAGTLIALAGIVLYGRAQFAVLREVGPGLDYVSFRQAMRRSRWHRTNQVGLACHALGVLLLGAAVWLH